MDDVARRLGHRFADPALLVLACTHRSHGDENNERLEYLGDGLLDFVIAAELFRLRPQAHEGALSRLRSSLVCEASLAALARELDLGAALQLGEGELKSGGFRRASILSDALEAVIGAVYVDAGFAVAERVCLALFRARLEHLPNAEALKDAKTLLQERLQARGAALPSYRLLEASGPAHRRHFRVACEIDDGLCCEAGAGSRRHAEQAAAALVLERLDEREGSDAASPLH
ncbi:MAG TPA: ribonuclease III [Nevskiaceae bacterium]